MDQKGISFRGPVDRPALGSNNTVQSWTDCYLSSQPSATISFTLFVCLFTAAQHNHYKTKMTTMRSSTSYGVTEREREREKDSYKLFEVPRDTFN